MKKRTKNPGKHHRRPVVSGTFILPTSADAIGISQDAHRALKSILLSSAAITFAVSGMWTGPLQAHGTMHTPASRIWLCRFADNPENPQDPACAAAVTAAGSSQFLYDWAGVRQGDANGQHQAVVPDGELCSGGGSDFGGLDLVRDDWRATSIGAGDDGNFEFIYQASAPHSTQDMLFYITPEGWDPDQPLTWTDLDYDPDGPSGIIDPFCHLTSVTLEQIPGIGGAYRMSCPLPARSGRHVIYNVWQRDDSPEAFYACIDVELDAETGDLLLKTSFEGAEVDPPNLPPTAQANGPYFGNVGEAIQFSSAGSQDDDGTIVAFEWDFGDGNSSGDANPTHAFENEDTYQVTLAVTDDDGLIDSSNTTAQVGEASNDLAHRLLIGYWHNFNNAAGYIPIQDVSSDWDIVNVAFAEDDENGLPGEVVFAPLEQSQASFIQGVQLLQSRGQKVLLSLGGANTEVRLETTEARDNFVSSMVDIINTYGFDGIDIDLEGGSLSLDGGDTITAPQTPAVVNMISAIQIIKSNFGPDMLLTMAPETAYVQGGFSTFGGIWGAYLPLIHALRNDLTVLHVQHYNTGSMFGADGVIYEPATVDFHVAMADMMITGYPAAGDPGNFFTGLRPDQVAIGLPASVGAAGSGHTSVAVVHQSLDCLIFTSDCDDYVPSQAHTDFRGLMTWSINWDSFADQHFSTDHRNYLDQNP